MAWRIPEQAKPYIDALRGLLVSGVYAASSLEKSELLNLPVVQKRAGAEATAAQRADIFIQTLEEIVQDKLKGKDRGIALRAFGLDDWQGVPSRDRYEEIAKLHGKPVHKPSWENFRKEPLDRFLFTVYLVLYREGEQLLHGKMSADATSEGCDRNSAMANHSSGQVASGGRLEYVLELYDITYNLPPRPGEPQETLTLRHIRALQDGVTRWRVSSKYWGKSPKVPPNATLFGPGTLRQLHDAPIVAGPHKGRAYVLELELPKPLNSGERFEFTILRRHDVDFADVLKSSLKDKRDRKSLTPTRPIEAATIRVRFFMPNRPASIWHYEELPDWLAPGIGSDTNSLNIDDSGLVSFSWRNLWIGYEYGIA